MILMDLKLIPDHPVDFWESQENFNSQSNSNFVNSFPRHKKADVAEVKYMDHFLNLTLQEVRVVLWDQQVFSELEDQMGSSNLVLVGRNKEFTS